MRLDLDAAKKALADNFISGQPFNGQQLLDFLKDVSGEVPDAPTNTTYFLNNGTTPKGIRSNDISGELEQHLGQALEKL